MSDSLPMPISLTALENVALAQGQDDPSDLSVAQVIERLRSGAMRAADLSAAVRVQCVGRMSLEGFTTEETARLLGVNERTVRRDRVTVRQQEAMQPHEELTAELVGEYQRITLASIARLARLVNAPDTPAKVKLEAEEMITRQHRSLIDMAERFEYMPKTANAIRFQARRRDPAAFERYRENLRLARKWDAVGKSRRDLDFLKLTEGEI